jgi:phosphate starvation-inducible PhoH-like protein
MTRKRRKKTNSNTSKIEQAHYKRTKLEAKSENQAAYIRAAQTSDVIFCDGPAGSGKTHIAVGLAVQAMKANQVEKIVITRPVVEAGEKIGFLPGSADKKLGPYMAPVFDELGYFVTQDVINHWRSAGSLEIVPIGFMRGRSFHNCFIVGDECQNLTSEQMKMFLTRMGMNSKLIITGDESQSDLPSGTRGAFKECVEKLDDVDRVSVIKLEKQDIVRNPIIPSILERLERDA